MNRERVEPQGCITSPEIDATSLEEVTCILSMSKPSRWPRRRPILERVSAISLLHPLRDSTTRGTKETLAAQQNVACAAIFQLWKSAAPCNVSCWSVNVTVTSRAPGWPLLQFGRKISAGRLWVPRIRNGTSFLGAKAANWAAENTASQMQCIQSPVLPPPPWWLPNGSAISLDRWNIFPLTKHPET